jgi:hypothetical protein
MKSSSPTPRRGLPKIRRNADEKAFTSSISSSRFSAPFAPQRCTSSAVRAPSRAAVQASSSSRRARVRWFLSTEPADLFAIKARRTAFAVRREIA